jgi:hypothetical protein
MIKAWINAVIKMIKALINIAIKMIKALINIAIKMIKALIKIYAFNIILSLIFQNLKESTASNRKPLINAVIN